MTIDIPRVFNRIFRRKKNINFAIALHGFRIIERRFGWKHVEFKVVVSTGQRTFQAWRCYEDFRQLARKMHVFEPGHMEKAAESFLLLISTRGSWQSTDHSRILSQLICTEKFMGELFFSVESPSCLIEFLREDLWLPAHSFLCKNGCSLEIVNPDPFVSICGIDANCYLCEECESSDGSEIEM